MAVTLVGFLGWVGATVSLFFFVSPVFQFYKLYKNKIQYNEISSIIILANYFSCIVWLIYGYSIKCTQIIVANCLGAIISLAWIWTYLVYMGKSHLNIALFYTMGLSAISFIIYILLAIVVNNSKVVGQICLILCSLSYASSAKLLLEVARTRNYKLIPIYSAILSLIGCTGWTTFGLLNLNFIIVVPNLVGAVISLAQIFTWKLYKKKSPLVDRVRDVSITQTSMGPNIGKETIMGTDSLPNLEPNNNPLPNLKQSTENGLDMKNDVNITQNEKPVNNNNQIPV